MENKRRGFLKGFSLVGAALVGLKALAQEPPMAGMQHHREMEPTKVDPAEVERASGYLPVVTPDLAKLPWQVEGGVKVFHLVAEPVKRGVPARQDLRCLGLQRQHARADDRGRRRRPCAH
jgi:hypothetical protein